MEHLGGGDPGLGSALEEVEDGRWICHLRLQQDEQSLLDRVGAQDPELGVRVLRRQPERAPEGSPGRFEPHASVRHMVVSSAAGLIHVGWNMFERTIEAVLTAGKHNETVLRGHRFVRPMITTGVK